MRTWLIHLSLVCVVSVPVLFTNLGGSRLWDRDEPRNAGCAEEMLQRGDWVTPIFNDELREQKPVLLYWLIMSAYTVFGVSEFSARFWSATLAVLTILMTYWNGKRLFSAPVGLWSAIALATSLMFVLAGRAATPDSVLIFCVTGALTCFIHGAFRPAESLTHGAETAPTNQRRFAFDSDRTAELKSSQPFPQQWHFLLPMYAFMGLGVLAKGPVGVVLPMAVIGMFLLLVRLPSRERTQATRIESLLRTAISLIRPFFPLHFLRTLWSMRPLTAVVVVLAIAAPWYIWVGLRTEGDFLTGFFLKEHFGRATTSFENHSGPIYFYPVAILVGFFPWSVFAVPIGLSIVRSLTRSTYSGHDGCSQADNSTNNNEPEEASRVHQTSNRTARLAKIFCLCWIGVFVGIFTIAQTKLPSYITPCYPALALLCGWFLCQLGQPAASVSLAWVRVACCVLAIVGLVFVCVVPFAAKQFLPGVEWLGLLGVAPALAGLVGWWSIGQLRWETARVAFAIGAVFFVGGLFSFGTVLVDQHQQADRLLTAIEVHRRSNAPEVATFGVLESSWVFYGKRPIFELALDSEPAASADVEADLPLDRTHSADAFHPSPSLSRRLGRNKDWKPKARPTVDRFLSEAPDAFVITTEANLEQLQQLLPGDFEVITRAPYFLQDETLVLLGRAPLQSPDTNQSPTSVANESGRLNR